jgi:hypothetical protein
VTRPHALAVALAVMALLGAGCGGPAATSSRAPGGPLQPVDPSSFDTCEAAFRAWVGLAQAINDPDTDILANLVASEAVQRRVFELCTLAEAERLNLEVPVEYVPGVREPMIQPDFETFADVECVDESPLLDGTPLCREVGH